MSSPSDFTPRQLRDRLLPPAGPHFVLDERMPVRVDFTSVEESTRSETEQTQASAQAINSALNSMRSMANMVSDAMSGLANEPSQVNVQFGLRLDASGKAFVVESEDAASLKVTLTWTPQTPPREVEPVRTPAWETAPDPLGDQREWGEDEYDEDEWNDDDERFWIEDDRPERGYSGDRGDRTVYRDDEDYDYPQRPSWFRRSPRSPWHRNRDEDSDFRSRW